MGWDDVLCLGMVLDLGDDAATGPEWGCASERAGIALTFDLARDDLSAAAGSTLEP